MASNFIGINRGKTENPGNISASTATQSVDFELRVDTGKSSTKEDIIKALEVFKQYVLSNAIQGGTAGANLPPL